MHLDASITNTMGHNIHSSSWCNGMDAKSIFCGYPDLWTLCNRATDRGNTTYMRWFVYTMQASDLRRCNGCEYWVTWKLQNFSVCAMDVNIGSLENCKIFQFCCLIEVWVILKCAIRKKAAQFIFFPEDLLISGLDLCDSLYPILDLFAMMLCLWWD